MSRRARILWLVAALVSLVINVLGGLYAAVLGEPVHAGIHTVLVFVSVAAIMVLRRRARQQQRVASY